jgi:hypothetical protein
VGLGASHFWVGYIAFYQGRTKDAEAPFLRYLDIARRLVEREPKNREFRTELAYAQSNLGSLREKQGDLEGALASFRPMQARDRAWPRASSSSAGPSRQRVTARAPRAPGRELFRSSRACGRSASRARASRPTSFSASAGRARHGQSQRTSWPRAIDSRSCCSSAVR